MALLLSIMDVRNFWGKMSGIKRRGQTGNTQTPPAWCGQAPGAAASVRQPLIWKMRVAWCRPETMTPSHLPQEILREG